MSWRQIKEFIGYWWEKLYPLILSAVALYLAKRYDWMIVQERLDAFLAAGISIASIFAGFLTTAKTMIYTSNTRYMLRIKEQPEFDNYINYIRYAIMTCFSEVLFCGIGFFVAPDWKIFHLALITLSVAMITTCYRSSSHFFILMKCDHQESLYRRKRFNK